jgi:CRP/FNR family transcriptional regulator, dissimilatory nitrate respiration regulator
MPIVNTQKLKKTQLLGGLSEDDLIHFSHICDAKTFQKGQDVFNEGDPAEGFYIVLDGQVKIFKVGSDGREQILRVVRPGETFAEAAAISGEAFPASAQAMSTIHTAFVPSERFRILLKNEPDLALGIIATLCRLLHNFVGLIEQLSLREVSARLAKHLLDHSLRNQRLGRPSDVVTLDVNKTVLAARLGTVSETLSRTLGKLRQSGVIEVEGKKIRILDHAALERLSAGI